MFVCMYDVIERKKMAQNRIAIFQILIAIEIQ